MLVAFYAPELKDQLDAVIAVSHDNLGEPVLDAMIGDSQDPEVKKKAVAKLLTAWPAMYGACKHLTERAAVSARDRFQLTGAFDE